MISVPTELDPRWKKTQWTAAQKRLIEETARFVVLHSARRTGKGDISKRHMIDKAMREPMRAEDSFFLFSAPTHAQAKVIFWSDTKKMIPKVFRRETSEVEKRIKLFNNANVVICGMDVPERIEGTALSGAILDEFANMKPEVWEHLYPMLCDPSLPRPGWAWLTGVPEGQNHFYKHHKKGLDPAQTEWATHGWTAEGILDPSVLAQARRDMSERIFRQEFGGEFIDFAGRAYYDFTIELHARELLSYDENAPLILCFDFNVEPGTCVVVQDQKYTGSNVRVAPRITAVIGEVHIPKHSDTSKVCRKILQDWGTHKGVVKLYGDASGGARGTSQVDGNDWDLIQQYLAPVFGQRLHMRVPRHNPAVKARLNAVNTRIMNADRIVRLLVDPAKAPRTVEDFEGVRILSGSAGEIDKKSTPELTHLTDGLGYYVEKEFPVYTSGARVSGGYY